MDVRSLVSIHLRIIFESHRPTLGCGADENGCRSYTSCLECLCHRNKSGRRAAPRPQIGPSGLARGSCISWKRSNVWPGGDGGGIGVNAGAEMMPGTLNSSMNTSICVVPNVIDSDQIQSEGRLVFEHTWTERARRTQSQLQHGEPRVEDY